MNNDDEQRTLSIKSNPKKNFNRLTARPWGSLPTTTWATPRSGTTHSVSEMWRKREKEAELERRVEGTANELRPFDLDLDLATT
jgi:hypothetical protein